MEATMQQSGPVGSGGLGGQGPCRAVGRRSIVVRRCSGGLLPNGLSGWSDLGSTGQADDAAVALIRARWGEVWR